MTTQNKNVPALRFPEFDDEWKETKLEDIAEFKNGLNYGKENSGKGLKIIGVGDFKNHSSISYESLEQLSGFENINKSYLLKEGDLVFVRSNGNKELIGRSLLIVNINERITHSGFTIRARIVKSEALPVFVSITLKTNSIKSQFMTEGGGTNISNLSQALLSKLQIPLPILPEQQKIAAFLTAVDEKIQQLTKKKELLERYKKGVMQKIFNQEIRFKDENGNDFADWEEKKGNEIFDSISNKNHNSDLPILAITQDYGAIPRDLIDYQISVTDKSVESYKVVEVGDFIISLRSFQGGIEYSNYKGICSPAYIILRSKVSINNLFYKHYLKTDSYIQRMNAKLEGIRDGKMVSYKYFSEIDLPLPSFEEQNKIADFFTAIENKINSVNQQLEKTKEYKKGLLQQMFV